MTVIITIFSELNCATNGASICMCTFYSIG